MVVNITEAEGTIILAEHLAVIIEVAVAVEVEGILTGVGVVVGRVEGIILFRAGHLPLTLSHLLMVFATLMPEMENARTGPIVGNKIAKLICFLY